MPPQPFGAFTKNPNLNTAEDSMVIIVIIQGTPGTFLNGQVAGKTVTQIHQGLRAAFAAEGQGHVGDIWRIAKYIKDLADRGYLAGGEPYAMWASVSEINDPADRAFYMKIEYLDATLDPIVGLPWGNDYSPEPLPTDPWYGNRDAPDDDEIPTGGDSDGGGETASPPPGDPESEGSGGGDGSRCYTGGWTHENGNPTLEVGECPDDPLEDAGSEITAESEYGRVWGITIEVYTMPEADFLLFQTGSSMRFVRYAS